MQRMNGFDSVSNNIVFKKENQRPWNVPTKEEAHIRLEAEKTISHLADATEREKKTLEAEQLCQLCQKWEEMTRQSEDQKTTIENKLASVIQEAADEKSQQAVLTDDLRLEIRQLHEDIGSISHENHALKEALSEQVSQLKAAKTIAVDTTKQMEPLNQKIQQLRQKSRVLKNEKAKLTTLFIDTLSKSKLLDSIASNERRLRKILEKKIKTLAIEKAKIQAKHNKMLKKTKRNHGLMALEIATPKKILAKHKMLSEKIYPLEPLVQKETHD